MNNNLYRWHDEHMVRYEMAEVDRAVQETRLLREAGLIGPSWLSRAVNRLGNLLKARRKGLQEQPSIQPNIVHSKSPKSV